MKIQSLGYRFGEECFSIARRRPEGPLGTGTSGHARPAAVGLGGLEPCIIGIDGMHGRLLLG